MKDLDEATSLLPDGILLGAVCPRIKKEPRPGYYWANLAKMLGPIPLDTCCYDEKGYIDYKKYKNSLAGKLGIEELHSFHKKCGSVLLVCTCPDVRNCHVTNYIAPGLHSQGLILKVFTDGKFRGYMHHLKGRGRKFKGKHGYYRRRWAS